MPRPSASVPPDAIRIEDEVWQEAFTRREPARPRPERRLHAIEGGRTVTTPVPPPRSVGRPAPPAPRTAAAQPSAAPRPVAAGPNTAPPAVATGPNTAPPAVAARPTAAPSAVATRPNLAPPRAVATRPPEARPTEAAVQPLGGVPGRRTVTIRGYGAERNLAWPEGTRRPQRRAYERPGFRPDRVAMWAVVLGILLVVVAIASAHG